MPGRHRALVAGASGLVGGHCLRQLLARPEYERVTALPRLSLGLDDPKLDELVIGFAKLGDIDLPPADHAFCALGTTIKTAGSREAFRRVDFEYAKAFAKAALRAGVRRFEIVSSAGTRPHTGVFYLQVKAAIEEAVSKMPFESVGIFRPSFLLGKRQEFRLFERVSAPFSRLTAPLLAGSLRKFRPIHAGTVASAMIADALSGAAGVRVLHFDEIQSLAKKLATL